MYRNGPSPQFLKRASIIFGIVVVILITQTTWFKGLFHTQKKVSVVDTTTTVGDVVDADTNGNGIPNWQERLWGLDPTVLYTNGLSNRDIIEQKKKTAGIIDVANNQPLTEEDRLARDLYSLAVSLGQSDANSVVAQEAAAAMGDKVSIKTISNKYTLSQLRTTPTSPTSLTTYKQSIQTAVKKIDITAPGIEIVIEGVTSGDYSQLPLLSEGITAYATAAQELKKVIVPIGLAQFHLDMINGLAGMAEGFVYLKNLESSSFGGLSGIALYKTHSIMFIKATNGINQYLQKYGIL